MTDKPTPEQIQREVGMTRDEAMKVAGALCWHVEQLCGPLSTEPCVVEGDDDKSVMLGNFATVIQQAFADRDGGIEQDAARYRWLRDESCPPHNFYVSVPDEFKDVRYSRSDVDAYIDEARQALAAKGDSRG